MIYNPLLSLGLIMLLGILSSGFFKTLHWPSITSYLIMGILLGPKLIGIVTVELLSISSFIYTIVLSFLAFTIGQNLSHKRLRGLGSSVIFMSFAHAIGSFIFVYLVMAIILKVGNFTALILGFISIASSPATIVMTVRDCRAKGKFTEFLLGVLAIDDIIVLSVFALFLSASNLPTFPYVSSFPGILNPVISIFITIFLAIMLGLGSAWLLIRLSAMINNKMELLIYTLGFIFLNTGLALFLHLSFIISNLVMAYILTSQNSKTHHFFEPLKMLDSPFYLIVFVLAGASLDLAALQMSFGLILSSYLIFRLSGKIISVFFMSEVIGTPDKVKRYLGLALSPHSGVAVILAMLVKYRFPDIGNLVLTTVISATVIYEILGPFITKFSLFQSGDIKNIK